MSGECSSYKSRAEHYRALAAVVSDETAHKVLIEMARELDAEAALLEPQREPLPRSFS